MPRTARLIDAVRSTRLTDAVRSIRLPDGLRSTRLADGLRDRGKALVFMGAAAALVGAGAASAATAAPASAATASNQQTALTGRGAPVTLAPQARTQVAAALDPGQGHAARSGAQQGAGHGAASADALDTPPAGPYEIYDSVTPSSIPSGHEVAAYADGPFAASQSSMAGKKVLWIDTNGSDPHASALDVEPGDVTPTGAGSWAAQKLHADPQGRAIIYTMRSEWPSAQAAVRSAVPAAEQSHVRWWIADPTGVPHVVPGSSATQWYWGSSYDISTATPGL